MRSRTLLLAFGLVLLLSTLPAQSAPPRPVAAKQTFDIVVSTEWEPGSADQLPLDLALAGCPTTAADTFLADLRLGLERFAAYFYRSTGGQMAIGKVTIHTGGVNWDQADIRILANGSYRPTAFIGGIVNTTTAFYRTAGAAVPTAVFTPAPILLSRQWDGRGARCGPWSTAAGWRTLGHEWGHYALFLYDEYADQFSGAPRYCDAADPRFRVLARGELSASDTGGVTQSLMAYHYTADQFSLWDGAAAGRCRETPQDTVYGASNWATIAQRYATAGVTAPAPLVPGPTDAPTVTFTVVPPTALRANTAASVKLNPLPGERLVGQAYLIRPNSSDGAPLRIIGQGNILPGAGQPLRFWGVQTDKQDRAAIAVQNYASNTRQNYPLDYRPGVAALRTDADNALTAGTSSWQPAMRITPIVIQNPGQLAGQIQGLRVELSECGDKQLTAVEFVYCPAGGDCGAPVQVTTADSAGRFVQTFYPSGGPSEYGYIYAREPFRGAETVSWYQLGGGVGPAHVPGHAPSAEGRLQLDMAQNDPRSPQNDARVLYAPAPFCTAAAPLPSGVLGIFDTPLRVQVAIGGPNVSTPWGGDAYPPLRVRLDYDQDLLDRLGIAEDQLVLLRLSDTAWKPVNVAGQSTALDWIRSAPFAFDPAGEIFALGYGPARTRLPGVTR